MTREYLDEKGAVPLLQSACAVFGSLLLLGVLAYAIVAAGVDLAGGPTPENEFATMWQQLNTPSAPTDDEATFAKRR